MSDSPSDGGTGSEPRTIYCMHCGTAADASAYACTRCGERVYLPDPARVPPLGFTSCQECATVNEAHAFYCATCSAEIDQSARISPSGITGERTSASDGDSRSGASSGGGGFRPRSYRIGSGSFNPNEWGLGRRSRSSREDDDVPPEIRRWNWGAFILGPIWGVFHSQWWSMIGFVGFLPLSPALRVVGLAILLGVMLTLGFRGNELAWRVRQWESAEKFLATQQRWATWSIAFAIGTLIAFILFLLGQG